jgi:hypothetical protein
VAAGCVPPRLTHSATPHSLATMEGCIRRPGPRGGVPRRWGEIARRLAPWALAALAAGCGTASQGGASWPPVGDGADAKAMVEAVAEATRTAAAQIQGDGRVSDVPVSGSLGTASVSGEVFHTSTPTFDGTDAVPTLDVDVDVVFDGYRVAVSDAGLAGTVTVTLTGAVHLLDTFPTPGGVIDPLNVLPKPVEVGGDVAAVYEGADAAGAFGQADTFAFDASGPSRDDLKGSLTNRTGAVFRF